MHLNEFKIKADMEIKIIIDNTPVIMPAVTLGSHLLG